MLACQEQVDGAVTRIAPLSAVLLNRLLGLNCIVAQGKSYVTVRFSPEDAALCTEIFKSE